MGSLVWADRDPTVDVDGDGDRDIPLLSGERTSVTFPVPPAPALAGLAMSWQACLQGEDRLTNPVRTTLRDL